MWMNVELGRPHSQTTDKGSTIIEKTCNIILIGQSGESYDCSYRSGHTPGECQGRATRLEKYVAIQPQALSPGIWQDGPSTTIRPAAKAMGTVAANGQKHNSF